MIKKLTVDNWREPEEFSRLFVDMNGRSMTGDDWVQIIMKPQVDNSVPDEVKELFEVARGAMVYGHFFHPLYALANEQLSRVAETAITHKYEKQGGPKKIVKNEKKLVPNFADKIDWLTEQVAISEEETKYWHSVRKYRNEVSHPSFQNKLAPGAVINLLIRFVEELNSLFIASSQNPD